MTDYLLRYPITETDCDFLNHTDIKYSLVDVEANKFSKVFSAVDELDISRYDSGWCDWDTGARIISERDRVVFENVSPAELTLLTLKFGERIKEFTDKIRSVYNYKDEDFLWQA